MLDFNVVSMRYIDAAQRFPPFFLILRRHHLSRKNQRTPRLFVSIRSSEIFITDLLEFF